MKTILKICFNSLILTVAICSAAFADANDVVILECGHTTGPASVVPPFMPTPDPGINIVDFSSSLTTTPQYLVIRAPCGEAIANLLASHFKIQHSSTITNGFPTTVYTLVR